MLRNAQLALNHLSTDDFFLKARFCRIRPPTLVCIAKHLQVFRIVLKTFNTTMINNTANMWTSWVGDKIFFKVGGYRWREAGRWKTAGKLPRSKVEHNKQPFLGSTCWTLCQQGPLCAWWDAYDQPGLPAQRPPQGDHRHRVQEKHHLILQQPLHPQRPGRAAGSMSSPQLNIH